MVPQHSITWTRRRGRLVFLSGLIAGMLVSNAGAQSPDKELTLDQAIDLAQERDPWLDGNRHSQRALQAQSIAAGTLPDPQVSASAANVPVDNFEFNREPMTQLKMGISQRFPRGDSRALKRRQLKELSQQHPFQRQNRRAQVANRVTQLWLDAYQARETITLIQANRELFEHLVDVAEANYASASGRTRQQDIVRAQLELTRLQDRLTALTSQQETVTTRLQEWLMDPALPTDQNNGNFQIANQLPDLSPREPRLLQPQAGEAAIGQHLLQHPAVLNLQRKIAAQQTGVRLAKQQYSPQWSLNAQYGYRDDDPLGRERSDFFTLGVSFDLPLFTANRQDQQVEAANAQLAASKTDKQLLVRQLTAQFLTEKKRLQRLNERHRLYQSQLLGQMHEQAEASLNAYTNDDGDFAEVARARIDELNARIDALDIRIQRLKIIAQLNYLMSTATPNTGNERS